MMEFLKLCRNMMYNAPTRQQRYLDFQKEINNGTNGASPLLESFRSLLQSLKLKLISVDDASQIYKELISDVDMAPAECTESNIQSVIEEFKEGECVPANLLINSGGVRFSSTARLLEHLAPRQLAFCGFIASECERFGSLACPSKKLLARVSTKKSNVTPFGEIFIVCSPLSTQLSNC